MATFSDSFEVEVIKVAKINKLCSESACAGMVKGAALGFVKSLSGSRNLCLTFDHLVLLIRLRDKHTD